MTTNTQADPWKDAIIDELVVLHLYRAEHENNPKLALKDAIVWNANIALDPAVSKDAQKLIEQGAAETTAKIVAWMRDADELYFSWAIEAIEAGEHLK